VSKGPALVAHADVGVEAHKPVSVHFRRQRRAKAWESGLDVLTVLTLQAAGAGDLHGGTKRLSNKMPGRPVVGRIPMHCLVFDLL
jgi:hypothetical protein